MPRKSFFRKNRRLTLFLFTAFPLVCIAAGVRWAQTKPQLEKLFIEVNRCGHTSALPVGRSLLVDIRSTVFRGAPYPVELRDQDGRLVSTGIAKGHGEFVEVQLPEIEEAGGYWLQIYDGREEVLEAPIKAGGTVRETPLRRVCSLVSGIAILSRRTP